MKSTFTRPINSCRLSMAAVAPTRRQHGGSADYTCFQEVQTVGRSLEHFPASSKAPGAAS
eukprot:5762786-Alexandrium_andersonii.AAC.1